MGLLQQIRDEYRALWEGTQGTFQENWSKYKSAILSLSHSEPRLTHLLTEITDDLDEGISNCDYYYYYYYEVVNTRFVFPVVKNLSAERLRVIEEFTT